MSQSSRAPKPPFLALVRHARAAPAGAGESDSARALSAEGRREFAGQLSRLESLGFACDQIWTSPWRRARETSDLLASRCKLAPQERAGLCSDLHTPAALELIAQARSAARDSRVVLVGHQPWLAALARALGAGELRDIDCGEVVWLSERAPGVWSVAARLHPS